jgi:NOL1/NOP2/sun family putative RNA methylase
MLPDAFLERMQGFLGSEFAAFEAALRAPRTNSLRVNTLKMKPEELRAELPVRLEPVSWCPAGFHVPYQARLGSSLWHALGVIYMQEASAMAVVMMLDPQPGERVLDLCAAPGGKTTQIAAQMRHGVLIANEVHAGRARMLGENLERLGASGTVLNEEPARIAQAWPGFFDAVLVDAPCSGEGMFRKNPQATHEWRPELVMQCARRQSDILESAAALLRPGGRLVYSTCTFAPEENEGVIAGFLVDHPEFSLAPIGGFAPGKPEWVGASSALKQTARLWPHLLRGEGHFIARLVKHDGEEFRVPLEEPTRLSGRTKSNWNAFASDFHVPDGDVVMFKGRLERLMPDTPKLAGLKVMRVGTALTAIKPDRLEPEHAFSHALTRGADVPALDLAANDPRLTAYLNGEAIRTEESMPDGWLVVRTQGFGLGWGKRVGDTLKNHYPKNLRGSLSAPVQPTED